MFATLQPRYATSRTPVRRKLQRGTRKKCALDLESLETRLAPSATYYVSPSGNDAGNGLSPETAWRTIGRVNTHYPRPGDTILFEGGQTFSGSLRLSGGDAANPMTVSSYGGDRAILASGTQHAIWAWTDGGLHINNLVLRGAGAETNDASGIEIGNARGVTVAAANIRVDNIDVSGYGLAGVTLMADDRGYDDVRITRVNAHHNANGIHMGNGDPNLRTITNLYVGYVQAHDNNRLTPSPMSGVGLSMLNVGGGVVERSLFYNNGATSPAPGHAGMLVVFSSNLTVQYNEAWGNADQVWGDGQGFAFCGVEDSVVQYNYSHDNGNGGFQTTGGAPGYFSRNITFRYNLSENDSVGVIVAEQSSDIHIYNNTIFTSPGPGGSFRASVVVMGWVGNNASFRNNIIMAVGGSMMLIVDEVTLRSGSVPQFQNNSYYSGHPDFPLIVGYGTTAYFVLEDWQNTTGQEMLFGYRMGSTFDPMLNNPGGGGTVGDPDQLHTITAYQLQEYSAFRTTGVDLRWLAVDPGGRDFFGNDLPQSSEVSFGCYQAPDGSTFEAPAAGDDLSEPLEVDAVPVLASENGLLALLVLEEDDEDASSGNHQFSQVPVATSSLEDLVGISGQGKRRRLYAA